MTLERSSLIGGDMWEPKLSKPLGGTLKVYLSDHPGVNQQELLTQEFNPDEVTAEDVADAVIAAVWEMQEHTPYGVQLSRTDVNWGADVSLVSVIVDVSSALSGAYTVSEIARRVRERIEARRQPGRHEA